jgi:sulfoxide reductase heme-binding subunit YedZ
LSFVGLDYNFDFTLIRVDIWDKRFVLAGLVAFVFLLPLAITSAKWWRRKLGKNWERLHWLVYPAAILTVVHFLWQVKADIGEPVFYAIVVALLLTVRIPSVSRALGKLRGRYKIKQ